MSILLEYKFTPGDVLKYQSSVETKQETVIGANTTSQDQKVIMNIRQEVKDFSNDIYRLEIFIESGSLVRQDAEEELPAIEKPTIARFKKNGEVIADQAQAQFSQQSFPKNPINVGDSWASQVNLRFPGREEPIVITYTYTFEKEENIDGFDCAYIKVSCPFTSFELKPGMTQSFDISGGVYFAYNEGILIKSILNSISEVKTPQSRMKAENKTLMKIKEYKGREI
ncbi:MAG: hypothetical protein ABIH00_07305 [Armatimonadota bacterium]